jgi:hypothetical protein
MAKRPHEDDMDMETIRREISTLNNRMSEVLTILGGSAAYDVRGMRADVKDLKNDVIQIKNEMEKIKREATDREKQRGFLSIKLETVPQKIAGFVAFIAVILTMLQSLKTLFTQEP